MIVIARLDPEEIWPYVLNKNEKGHPRPQRYPYEDLTINTDSTRLRCFAKNPSCVCCGITGTVILLEKHLEEDNPHFNLYAEAPELVLMTKDHIKPKSKGGRDIGSNFQTMCTICNRIKDCAPITIPQLQELRKQYFDIVNSLGANKANQMLNRLRSGVINGLLNGG
jgi:5-methylcytosine-specific restriction endonuclease McrA